MNIPEWFEQFTKRMPYDCRELGIPACHDAQGLINCPYLVWVTGRKYMPLCGTILHKVVREYFKHNNIRELPTANKGTVIAKVIVSEASEYEEIYPYTHSYFKTVYYYVIITPEGKIAKTPVFTDGYSSTCRKGVEQTAVHMGSFHDSYLESYEGEECIKLSVYDDHPNVQLKFTALLPCFTEEELIDLYRP